MIIFFSGYQQPPFDRLAEMGVDADIMMTYWDMRKKNSPDKKMNHWLEQRRKRESAKRGPTGKTRTRGTRSVNKKDS